MSDPLSFLLWPEPDKCDFMDYAVEPSALSFYDPAALFPFTFDPGSPSDSSSSLQSSSSGRRLSTSSSASSLSPAPPAESDAAALLAERVRQSAGVMLALPMPLPLNPQPPPLPPKLPIPRLPRPVSQPPSSSAASTPPPSTPAAAPTPSPQPRSKTSHTTIERRYRTNLNARIQSLRMAVPALRVVDDRDPTKNRAPNKVLVSADPPRPSTLGDDVVDERGFVDGVKVARKCSKANVLGKAVEYIRVLKRREARLKNEQAGLKSLVAGLVGGPALLKEWEREWREMFGGEEKDEVDPEAEADDDDDDDDDDNDDEGGRKRKRSKVAHVKPEKKVVSSPDGTVPEKRKRGRPRKVVPPPTVPAEHPQQYLLATFALFSFFNSPLTSFSTVHVHTHTGTVLNGSPGPLATDNTRLSYWLHLLHLLVSTLILVRCVSSWAGIKFNLSPSISILTALSRTAQNHKDTEKRTLTHWIRLAESFVFSPHTHRTLLPRVQAYHRITTEPSASPSDMCTALLALYGCGTPLGGIARARARKVWREWLGVGGREYERLVFEMGVDEAVGCVGVFGAGVRVRGEDGDGDWTPMRVLGTMIVMRRMRACLGGWFVGVVCGRDGGGDGDGGKGEGGEREYRRTVEAARELGGYVGELGRRFERLLCGAGAGGELRELGEEEDDDDDGVGALMDAVVLYRRVFGGAGADGNAVSVSMPPSPPPSPGRKAMVRARVRDEDVGRLRRALGSRVFEETEALEDARDRAVDRVVEFERWSMGLRHEV